MSKHESPNTPSQAPAPPAPVREGSAGGEWGVFVPIDEDTARFAASRRLTSTDEVIAVDERSELTPSQAVENRLVALLSEVSLPVSHLQMRRGLMISGRRDDPAVVPLAAGEPAPSREPTPVEALADPSRPTLQLVHELLEDPQAWLGTANTQLGDRKPIDLIGTEEEVKVFNLLSAVDQGLF